MKNGTKMTSMVTEKRPDFIIADLESVQIGEQEGRQEINILRSHGQAEITTFGRVLYKLTNAYTRRLF